MPGSHKQFNHLVIYPNPFHHITTVEYVTFVGCNSSFSPGYARC
jgi:hypothetical protein